MRTWIIGLAALALVGCSQTEPKAVAVETSSPPVVQTAEVDQWSYKLLDATYVDEVPRTDVKGKWVHVRFRVTNQGQPLWFSQQYQQLVTDVGTYEDSGLASYNMQENAQYLMPTNDWKEINVWFDIPSEETPEQIILKRGPEDRAVTFEVSL